MTILNFTFSFIRKFKTKHITSSCENIPFFWQKNFTFRNTFSPYICLYRCVTFNKPYRVDSVPCKSCNGKLFQEKENEYAHQVMENLSCYSSSLLKCPLQSRKYISKCDKPSGYLNAVNNFAEITLHNLSGGSNLEEPQFTDLVEEVCTAVPEASDEDIKKILHYLCMWPDTSSVHTPNYKMLWSTLDRECMKRLKHWDVSQKLLIADYWFHLRLSRIVYYNSVLINNLIQSIDSLSNHQVVQLMFYVNLQRKIPDLLLPSLEKKLELIINCLTVEEIGIICLGFFKTQSKVLSVNLTESIIKQFMHNVEHLNTLTVVAVLKFLRKSLNFSLIDLYILSLHKCVSCIDNFDIPTSVHLALLSSQCNVYHPLLLNCVSEKLAGEMNNVRIKDCAKLLLCLSQYNHFEGNFHNVFFAELKKERKQSEIVSHPEQLVCSALFYAYMGHYNYDLLTTIFKKEFIEKCCSQSPEMKFTFAEIDYCIEIECPGYTGPKLDVTKKKILQHRRGNLPSKSQNQNMQTRLISDVYDSLVEILGSNKNILIRHILPHIYSPDIIVRLSGNTKKSLTECCYDLSTDFVLKPPLDEVWAAFVVLGVFSFAYKSTHMTGISSMKLRQLEKIGYHVIFIPYFNISRKASQRKSFLEEKLKILEKKYKTVVL